MKTTLKHIGFKQKGHPQHSNAPHHKFCVECGEELDEGQVVEEYVCPDCRHLVGKDDKFCWQCGVALGDAYATEYYDLRGRRITREVFNVSCRDLH